MGYIKTSFLILLLFYSSLSFSSQGLSKFAEDVLMHVFLHELSHAIVREFDLPVLGNEEALADAFATYYITQYLTNDSYDIIKARIDSLIYESSQVPRENWSVIGEHNNDRRRAYQIISLALASDKSVFFDLAISMDMTEKDIARSVDYGSEILRSWRRTLRPIMMPPGLSSAETFIGFDPGCQYSSELKKSQTAKTAKIILESIDWHSTVRLQILEGEGGASWSRSKRTISIRCDYIQRFIEQGKAIK